MSAKGEKNCRFFHLLRFLGIETIAKRAKRPTLSSVGEQVLAQYEQRLRREEDLTALTIGTSLSDRPHFAACCQSSRKQGREEDLPLLFASDPWLWKPSQEMTPFLSLAEETHAVEPERVRLCDQEGCSESTGS